MSITMCGPICDVGGEYILLDRMGAFSVEGIAQTLHYCESHKAILQAAADTGHWEDLLEGPLRSAFEAAAKAIKDSK